MKTALSGNLDDRASISSPKADGGCHISQCHVGSWGDAHSILQHAAITPTTGLDEAVCLQCAVQHRVIVPAQVWSSTASFNICVLWTCSSERKLAVSFQLQALPCADHGASQENWRFLRIIFTISTCLLLKVLILHGTYTTAVTVWAEGHQLQHPLPKRLQNQMLLGRIP